MAPASAILALLLGLLLPSGPWLSPCWCAVTTGTCGQFQGPSYHFTHVFPQLTGGHRGMWKVPGSVTLHSLFL